MDITPKSKIMSKDDVVLLVELIQSKPVLNSKETNFTTNKIKDDTWIALTSTFNANTDSFPRTETQLKLKWDNLKKAARKRYQQKETGGVKPDLIQTDEILEKVASILGLTCTGFMVPFGGDDVGCDSIEKNVSNDATQNVSGRQERKRKKAGFHDIKVIPTTDELKTKKGIQKADDGRRARNLAMARYYDKKTEKLNLEINLLRLELKRKQNRNCK